MKNLHERLTKNLGRRLLIGVFFIFLGMAPAIYIWSCVPNNKPSPVPIPPFPTPMSVSNIEFNTNNDYLFDYYRNNFNTSRYNKYISLKDNQYIYYDTESKINFINSESKITPIENQKVAKAVGKFNNKNVIILNNNDNFKLGLVDDKNIEYININKFDLDFSMPMYVSQSSETTFNLVYFDKKDFINLLQFDTLTNIFYNHNLIYQNQKVKKLGTGTDIIYQNGIIAIIVYGEWRKEIKGKDINAELINNSSVGTEIESEIKGCHLKLKLIESDEWYLYWNGTEDKKSYSNKAVVDFLNQIDKVEFSYPQKLYTVSNNEIINDNNDIVINENEIYTIPPFDKLFNLNSHTNDYKIINRNKIKIVGYDSIGADVKVWNKTKVIYEYKERENKTNIPIKSEFITSYSVVYVYGEDTIKVFYLGDMLNDDYNYLIYEGKKSFISMSENNLYIIDYTNGYLNIKYYDIYSKKMINKEFKNIKDIKLKKGINFNNFYIYQGNYYFNIYENNNLKVFTNNNNIANINIDKYKLTRYKNNLVVLTKDKCLLLNLDSKNTTEFNLKDFDFDNSNSEFINANFDKNNILFKNNNTIQLFVFKL